MTKLQKFLLPFLLCLIAQISFGQLPIVKGKELKLDSNSDGTFVTLSETDLSLVDGTKTANYVLAGPATGSPAVPTFRALVNADLASITLYGLIATANTWTNTNGFTNLVTISRDYNGSGAPTGNSAPLTTQLVDVDATSTKYTVESWATNPNGDADINRINHRISATGTAASVSVDWANAGGTPVVAATSPLEISTTTGAVSFGTKAANYVLAGPTSGGDAAPTFRALVSADVPAPTLDADIAYEDEANVFTNTNYFNNTDTSENTILDVEVAVDTPGTTDPLIHILRDGDTTNTTNPLLQLSTHSTGGAGTSLWNITARAFAAGLGPFSLRLPESSGTFVATATSPLVVSASTGNMTLGTVGVTSGGTGIATVAQGDLLYGSASNTLSALAKDANATRYLSNTGTSNNPAWAQVNVANGITGTVPIANGGTNSTATPTNGYFAKGDGTTYTFFDLMGGTNTWTGINTFSNKIVNSATLTADGYLYTGTLTSATANLADLVAVKGTLAKSGSDNDGGDTATVNQYAGQFSATDTGTITDTGGSTYNTFGVKGSGSDSGANTSGNTNRNTFGGDFSASSTGAITAGTPIRNSYGVRGVATGTTGGTSTAYGVYGSASGADVNWGGYFEGNLAATGTLGYTTGAGGTVTQATSKATGVTLDKACGTITMHAATLNAATAVSFTLTNSKISATDVLIIQHDSAGTLGAYVVAANTMASGSCQITVRNISAGNLGEAIVLRFALVKGVVT